MPLAFGAGLLSFLSPCVLPLVPVYLANLSGVSLANTAQPARRLTPFMHALSFVLGFSLVFIILGVSVGLAGPLITGQMGLWRKIAGALLVVFGLHLLGVLRLPFLDYEKRLAFPGGSKPAYIRSFLTGIAFSIGWTPCISPILGGILALAWTSSTVGQGAFLLGVYAMGLGLPFLAMGFVLSSFSRLLSKISRYLRVISVLSGLMLIALGVLIFTGKLVLLNRYFDFLPWSGGL